MFKISWARVATMLVYLIGIGMFIGNRQWTEAIMLLVIVYWSNVAWFFEGKSKHTMAMLVEAKEIMEQAIRQIKEPVSEKGEEA